MALIILPPASSGTAMTTASLIPAWRRSTVSTSSRSSARSSIWSAW